MAILFLFFILIFEGSDINFFVVFEVITSILLNYHLPIVTLPSIYVKHGLNLTTMIVLSQNSHNVNIIAEGVRAVLLRDVLSGRALDPFDRSHSSQLQYRFDKHHP